MAKGVVKFFDTEKGFGFIKPEGGGEDVYFLRSAVKEGVESLQPGAEAAFDMGLSKSGRRQAVSVTVKAVAAAPSPRPSQGAPPRPAAGLSPECVFKSFLDDANRPVMALFKGPPETAARELQRAGLKATQFRQVYNAFQGVAGALRDRRIEFEDARVRLGAFYTERIVRQAQRGHLPSAAKELFDRHWDLALSSREQMLGLFTYIKSIYCYFEDKGDR